MKKPKINHVVVNISAKFGSEFQQETALNTLSYFIKSWVAFYSGTHKKNEIGAEISYPGKIKYWPTPVPQINESQKL